MSVCRSSPPPVTPSPSLPRRGVGGGGGRAGSARRVCWCRAVTRQPARSAPALPGQRPAEPRRAGSCSLGLWPRRARLRSGRAARVPGPAARRGFPAGRVRQAGAAPAAHPRPRPGTPGWAAVGGGGAGSAARQRGGERGRWGRGRLSLLYSPLFPPSRYPRLRPSPLPGSRLAPARPLRSGGGPGHGDPGAPRGQQTPHRVSSAWTRSGPAAAPLQQRERLRSATAAVLAGGPRCLRSVPPASLP